MTAQTITLPPEKREGAVERLAAFLLHAWAGKRVRVTFEEAKPQRSHEQNAYLFGACYAAIRDATGNDVDDLHTLFCGEYFGWREIEVLGSRRKVPMRTTTRNEAGHRAVLSTAEFSEFVAFIQNRAAEYGVFIPDANQQEAA